MKLTKQGVRDLNQIGKPKRSASVPCSHILEEQLYTNFNGVFLTQSRRCRLCDKLIEEHTELGYGVF